MYENRIQRRARGRARRANGEAGGILFIVSMTLSVLATLGVYALNTAAAELRMSGYQRQSTMTHYIAQYGATGAGHMLSNGQGYADAFLSQMLDPARTNYQPANGLSCTVLAQVQPNAYTTPGKNSMACSRIEQVDMYQYWSTNASNAGWPTPPKPTWPIARQAGFYVEVVDPAPSATAAGFVTSQGGGGTPMCFVSFEVTGAGLTEPESAAQPTFGNTQVQNTSGQAACADVGSERVRAVMTTGPVSKGCY
jgi:Tfp pilus assembly protein PilX